MSVPAHAIRRSLLVAVLLGATTLLAPAAGATSHDPVIVAVGDLACQSLPQGQGAATCQSGKIADLIRDIDPDRFLALGDLQYNNAKLSEILRVWDKQFGDLLDITSPAPGNHEYGTSGAAGYFEYFGERANPDGTDPPTGYYSFDLGDWHIVSLNSDACGDDPGCVAGTDQYEWLADDLADHPADCTLAYWHHPRYDWRPWQKWVDENDTTPNGGSEVRPLIPLWELMYDEGVDVVLSAHNHLYQRWVPQDGRGNSVADGAVQFTVGTGGRSLYPFGRPPKPENLEVTQNDAYGLLQMTLHADSYSYEWVSAAGQPAFEDAGTVDCH